MRDAIREELTARRAAIEHAPDLRALAGRLRGLLDPLLERPLYLPDQKPLLSQDGGVCAADGARLVFDPMSPRQHRCPRCSRVLQGERHHRSWIWRYHLWLSERAIHMALLAELLDDPSLAARAETLLAQYAVLYPEVPNRDNELGPTHLFFSTYLESVWLVQIVMAASLLEAGSQARAAGALRAKLEPIVEESGSLIASFDEGISNRQVWNSAAILAAATWLDDPRLRTRALAAPHGLPTLFERGIGADGLWFEGENYHFFTLRAFMWAAEFLRWIGRDPYGAGPTGARLQAMLEAPLETLLPDLTLPARGDAPFGVSILQPRFAELWEHGWVRAGAPRLEHLLARLYATDLPAGEEHGFTELAEQERNRAAHGLARDRLGWKALLWMRPDGPRNDGRWMGDSRVMDAAGLCVMRAGRRYVSVEAGGQPGGHGHPDLLHLTLYWDDPLFLDFGTGSYVSESLHWYRSALAHNAPSRSNAGQDCRVGRCEAMDRAGPWSWCCAAATDVFGPGTSARRSLVVGPDYVVDIVEVEAPTGMGVDLPLHPVGAMRLLDAEPAEHGTSGWRKTDERVVAEDAVEILAAFKSVRRFEIVRESRVTGHVHLPPRRGEIVLQARAPGPPDLWFADGEPLTFLVRRARGRGRWVQVYARSPDAVRAVELTGDVVVVHRSAGARDRVAVRDKTVTVRPARGEEYRLAGARDGGDRATGADTAPRLVVLCVTLPAIPEPEAWSLRFPADAVVCLDSTHYRRSELPYGQRGPFTARLAWFRTDTHVGVAVDVVKTDLTFRAAGGPEPRLDNEPADIHSDGVQFYVGLDEWSGYLVVPESGGGARVRATRGSAADPAAARAAWRPTRTGYTMVCSVPVARSPATGTRFRVNLVINEMYPDRERRAGQLALAGGGGWVYLRGDRESPAEAAWAEVV